MKKKLLSCALALVLFIQPVSTAFGAELFTSGEPKTSSMAQEPSTSNTEDNTSKESVPLIADDIFSDDSENSFSDDSESLSEEVTLDTPDVVFDSGQEDSPLSEPDSLKNASQSSTPLPSASGVCTETINWDYDAPSRTLTISGTGSLPVVDGIDIDVDTSIAGYHYYCRDVEHLVVKEGITEIPDCAFYYIHNLKTLSLPESLEELSYLAFSANNTLREFYIPKNLTYVSCYMFEDFQGLEQIRVSEEHPYYTTENGILYDKEKTTLISVPRNYQTETLYIPETVSDIGKYALAYNNKLRTVYLPAGLSYLESRSLYSMQNLQHLIFSGAAPEFNSYHIEDIFTEHISSRMPLLRIYCSFAANGWTDLINSSSSSNLEWIDLDTTYPGVDTLSIDAASDTLKVGEALKLSPAISPLYALDFEWESSDHSVADILPNNYLIANRPGKVIVTLKSRDGKYQAQKEFTVTGEQSDALSDGFDISDGEMIPYNSYDKLLYIPCIEKNGFYIFSDDSLFFCSLTGKQARKVHTFVADEITSVYNQNNLLYVTSYSTCWVYDLLSGKVIRTIEVSGYSLDAVGVDPKGRIYLCSEYGSNSHIWLYDSNGTLLTETTLSIPVYRFSGFDAAGNFYVEGYYDFRYWGYSHPGRGLYKGTVKNNKITLDADNMLHYLGQDYYRHHTNSAELLGGRYLTSVSSVYNNVKIFDTKDSKLDLCMEFERDSIEPKDDQDVYYDTGSIGVRTLYDERHNSIILYENNCQINGYDISTSKKNSNYKTKYPVFHMFWLGEKIVLVEKNGSQFYIETVTWGDITELYINGPNTLKAGEYSQLSVSCNMPYFVCCKWSSSDPKVVSVTNDGHITAWKKGSAVITAEIQGKKVQKKITVTAAANTSKDNKFSSNGTVSQNLYANDYYIRASTVNSYLYENSDKTMYRVEYYASGKLAVEKLNSKGGLIQKLSIKAELPLFGGFYHGRSANYLVFGKANPKESDTAEIMRVVKYSHSWKRLGDCRFYGNNTNTPFDAGSLRMAEAGDLLYIHTCHSMYKSDDGYNHQANMTYVINQSSMKENQSFYDILNFSQAGYVSHSFNQFVQTDENYVFRVDHGDSYPRGITLSRSDINGDITDIRGIVTYGMQGASGDNFTGVSIGGFELSGENCLIAFNSLNMASEQTYNQRGPRNIFISITPKTLHSTSVKQITSYKSNSKVEVYTPHLVKLNEYQFLLMWTEYNTSSGIYTTKMVTLDGQGNLTSPIAESDKLQLSDCQPVFTSDGLVKWYSADGKKVSFYTVNPYNLHNIICSPSAALNIKGHLPLQVKKTAKLKVLNLSKNDSVAKWTSSNSRVASVSSKGTITGKKAGTAIISAVLKSGKTLKKTVKVQTGVVKTTSISISKKTYSLAKGKKLTLSPVLTPITSGQKVTYTSSNKKVATVSSSGVVKGIKKGTAKITITSGTKKITVTVNIK